MMEVTGEPGTMPRALNSQSTVDGLKVTLRWSERRLEVHQPQEVTVVVTTADGQPVVLEPLMGSLAHIVSFSEDRTEVAHVHPVGDPAAPMAHVEFTTPGLHRLFVQVQVGGRVATAAFGIKVNEAPPGEAATSHEGHSH